MEDTNSEQIFNAKIRQVLSDLVLTSPSNSKQTAQDLKAASTCQVFVYLKPSNSVKLGDLRILLLANFIAKLMNERVNIYTRKTAACVETGELETFYEKLARLFQYFQFEKNLNLKLIDDGCETNNSKQLNLDKLFSGDYITGDDLVDLSKVLKDLNLNYYDKQLKYGNLNQYKTDSVDLALSYQDFIDNNKSKRLLHICLSSEFFQRQRNDLITRILLDDQSKHQKYSLSYVCIGKSMLNNKPIDNENENDALLHIQAKQKQFRHLAEQRNLISDDNAAFNSVNFTKFSLTYHILGMANNTDINRMSVFDVDSSGDKPKSEPSSFILYNCARLHAVVEKFESLQNSGAYASLPAVYQLNFFKTFKSEYELKMCTNFLFEYKNLVDELRQTIIIPGDKSIQTKIDTPKLLYFLSNLSNLFSRYYSKVHVLEDPKLVHLHEIMYCRVYLLKAVYNIFKLMLDFFNIDPVNRI